MWLCSYCGATYETEADGILHEVRVQTTKSCDFSFHANLIDCQQLEKDVQRFDADVNEC